jgi:hypothetical protein
LIFLKPKLTPMLKLSRFNDKASNSAYTFLPPFCLLQ